MSQKKILLSLVFLISSSTVCINAGLLDIRELLHINPTIQILIPNDESILEWLDKGKEDPIRAFIIINLLEGVINELIFPNLELQEAMMNDQELQKEILTEAARLPLYIEFLYNVLEKNQHLSIFKEEIRRLLYYIDCQELPSIIEENFNLIENKINLYFNSKIPFETKKTLIGEIHLYAARLSDDVKKILEKEETKNEWFSSHDETKDYLNLENFTL